MESQQVPQPRKMCACLNMAPRCPTRIPALLLQVFLTQWLLVRSSPCVPGLSMACRRRVLLGFTSCSLVPEKNRSLGVAEWIQTRASQLQAYVISDKWLSLARPPFPHMENGGDGPLLGGREKQ